MGNLCHRMDSAEDSGHLTDQLIAELAASAVSAKDAKSLVQRFMKITAVEVSNIQFDSDNAAELTCSLFRTWRNQSKQTNQVKVNFKYFTNVNCQSTFSQTHKVGLAFPKMCSFLHYLRLKMPVNVTLDISW